jgi:hypothetical protein
MQKTAYASFIGWWSGVVVTAHSSKTISAGSLGMAANRMGCIKEAPRATGGHDDWPA